MYDIYSNTQCICFHRTRNLHAENKILHLPIESEGLVGMMATNLGSLGSTLGHTIISSCAVDIPDRLILLERAPGV